MSQNVKIARTVTLTFEGKTYEFPVTEGTEKELGFDISSLRAKTGLVTMDNGYANTSGCQSSITFLDGEEGILRYRGIPIEQLAEKSNFLEVSYLLVYGRLPTGDELKTWEKEIGSHSELPESAIKLLQSFPRNAHPMAVVSSVICSLSANYADTLDPANIKDVDLNIKRLIAQIPVITAYAYKHSIGEAFVASKKDWDYCGNFLRMMFGNKSKDYNPPKELVDAMNLLLILHADHEQNCSTSTVRLIGSSAANLYASVAGGVNALWGPLHGGANQAVMEMLQEIHKDGGDVNKYVALAKDKTSSFKLMGFGHRVYKNFDPRAAIIKVACDKVLNTLGIRNPLLEIAKKLEAAALKDSYFVEKKLYPNVDFYSGIIYSALNIPVNMFTPMFAFGRMPGWVAHWKEMNESGTTKIGRPRQIYTGANKTDYTPVTARTTFKKAA